jgi:hypothetical protein
MKLIGNIVCTIAILTQIILSAGLLSHAPDCGVTQFLSVTATASGTEVTAGEHNHHCGCDHYHTAPVSNEICDSASGATTPTHDCTCTPQKNYPYFLGDHIAEQKSKNHFLDGGSLVSARIDFSQLSLLLCKSNQSNAPPPDQGYLPQHDTRFTSIHLGVFLI